MKGPRTPGLALTLATVLFVVASPFVASAQPCVTVRDASCFDYYWLPRPARLTESKLAIVDRPHCPSEIVQNYYAANKSQDIGALIKQCNAGCAHACVSTGHFAINDLLTKDWGLTEKVRSALQQRAYAANRAGCVRGHYNGCNNLAIMFVKGLGVPQDALIALALYSEACALEKVNKIERQNACTAYKTMAERRGALPVQKLLTLGGW